LNAGHEIAQVHAARSELLSSYSGEYPELGGHEAMKSLLVLAFLLHGAALCVGQTLNTASTSPTSVNTSSAPAAVTVTLGTVSTFVSCTGVVAASSGFTLSASLTVTNLGGGAQSLVGVFTLPRFAPQGTWVLSTIACMDGASVWRNFSRTGFPAGVQTGSSFTQVNIGPPAILSASVSPTSFTTRHGTVAVLASASAASTDTFNWCQFLFAGPDGLTFAGCTANAFTNTTFFGTVSCLAPVNTNAPAGVFALTRLECVDSIGRSNVLTSLASSPLFGVSFTQTSANDLSAPVITSFSISPSSINTSESKLFP
jgi:hypothetical protein